MDAPAADVEPLVTVRRAAKMIGVGRHVLYRACERGQLRIFNAGGWSRLRLSDLEAWLESTKRVPRA